MIAGATITDVAAPTGWKIFSALVKRLFPTGSGASSTGNVSNQPIEINNFFGLTGRRVVAQRLHATLRLTLRLR